MDAREIKRTSRALWYDHILNQTCEGCNLPKCQEILDAFLKESQGCCRGKLRRKYIGLLEQALQDAAKPID